MKKNYRVKTEKEFQAVFHHKKSYANRKFVVYVLEKPEQKHFRIGISVGKKIGNAVNRNAVKRKIRAITYELKEEILPNYDFIIIARPSVETLTSEEILTNIKHVLTLAEIMKTREE